MAIDKSAGVTPTERLLADYCERSFLKLWSYPNVYRDDADELCDLLAVFDNQVFIFMDRESRQFDKREKDPLLNWKRWKRNVIDSQIRSVTGAERYLKSGRDVYLDDKLSVALPLDLDVQSSTIYKIVVAHGAKDACKEFSDENVYGSLGISYGTRCSIAGFPFMIDLDKSDPVHVLDSHNLSIILGELDTFYDFASYLAAKEKAIVALDCLAYCGEEDLLAHYFLNYDEERRTHFIGTQDKSINYVMVGEGEWKDFIELPPYKRRQEADKVSYLWDDLIQRTCQNALDGTLLGNADLLRGESAIHEMAKEPRFSRRALSEQMFAAISTFPDSENKNMRLLNYMPSFFPDVGYVFIQLRTDTSRDYEEYRAVRRTILEIACGAARNKFSHLRVIVGIAIEPPKFSETVSEDFILIKCDQWSDEQRKHYEQANRDLGFFATPELKQYVRTVKQFPDADEDGEGR